MAKIKIKSAEMKCKAQVVVIDTNFVSRVVRAHCKMQQVKDALFVEDPNGNIIIDDSIGCVPEYANKAIGYLMYIDSLLKDIVDAFEEEEDTGI